MVEDMGRFLRRGGQLRREREAVREAVRKGAVRDGQLVVMKVI